MLLKILDILECPICRQASRLWKLNGEVTETRITNGIVICPEDHEWVVKEEILRFDKQNSDEQMQFLDHPRTGFPDNVKEQERFDFFEELEALVKELVFDPEEMVLVTGDPILFMKYIKPQDADFVIVYDDEGTLRQLQELAARKRMYDQMAFVRAEEIGYLGKINKINLLQEDPVEGRNILLTSQEIGEIKWSGDHVNLAILDN